MRCSVIIPWPTFLRVVEVGVPHHVDLAFFTHRVFGEYVASFCGHVPPYQVDIDKPMTPQEVDIFRCRRLNQIAICGVLSGLLQHFICSGSPARHQLGGFRPATMVGLGLPCGLLELVSHGLQHLVPIQRGDGVASLGVVKFLFLEKNRLLASRRGIYRLLRIALIARQGLRRSGGRRLRGLAADDFHPSALLGVFTVACDRLTALWVQHINDVDGSARLGRA